MNYDSWGNVIFKLDSSMTVEGIKNFNINFDHKLNINSIYTSDIKFIDIIINKQYFKRSYKDFTYYIDNIEQKIVFTLNKIKHKCNQTGWVTALTLPRLLGLYRLSFSP